MLLTDGVGTRIYHVTGEETFHKEKFTWTAAELRQLWKRAGIHVYLDADDVLYAGGGWLSVHTVEGGMKTIRFPFYAKIINPLTQEVITDSVKSVTVNLSRIYQFV